MFRLTKLAMKLLAKYEWRIWTLKWSLVLRLKKKMKDKYSHYFCRSRQYIEIHSQSRRHDTAALGKYDIIYGKKSLRLVT